MKKPIIATTLAALALSCLPAKAQPPLFAGYNGSKYALESRVNQYRQVTEVAKTFRTAIPAWAYFGASSDGSKKPFYGVGPRIEDEGLHALPTLEWYGGNFTGVSGYSSVDLPNNTYLDLVPHLDSNLNYAGTEFTLHRPIKGIEVGASSSLTEGELGDVILQAGKYWDNCSVTGDFTPETKTGKVSFQLNFN